jgi:hypothetical protein
VLPLPVPLLALSAPSRLPTSSCTVSLWRVNFLIVILPLTVFSGLFMCLTSFLF